VRASWAVVPGCTETFGLVLYIDQSRIILGKAGSGRHISKPKNHRSGVVGIVRIMGVRG